MERSSSPLTPVSIFNQLPAIGPEEAPSEIVREAHTDLFPYRAALAKPRGNITSDEFTEFSQRFLALCDDTFEDMELQVIADGGVPVGAVQTIAASQGEYSGSKGHQIDPGTLDAEGFEALFKSAKTIQIMARPGSGENPDASFASIEWTRSLPDIMLFYAQAITRKNEQQIPEVMAKKMFYVPGSAPRRNMRVGLGVGAQLQARNEGKVLSRASKSLKNTAFGKWFHNLIGGPNYS
ncbi:MAG TPA: hypothetical protein VHB72_01295 [Candidatus Saccharimonadales bacterium]|nr:hypothetical protein [Candidatus Saccharimonadales bacterium]